MIKFLQWLTVRATCLLWRRHGLIADKAIFGRVLTNGRREGLHICPYCGCYVWRPDPDPEIITTMH